MTSGVTFERHLQSALGIVVVSVIIWVGVTLLNNSNTLARLDERVIGISQEIEELKKTVASKMQDRFTGREGQFHARRIEANEKNIERMFDLMREQEKRLDALEQGNGQ